MSKDPGVFIGEQYAECLKVFGDTYQGVHWPSAQDVPIRYQIMSEVVRSNHNENVSLLDFGCGAGHYFEYLQKQERPWLNYSGLDISKDFIELCQKKFPQQTFYHLNINESDGELPLFDYVVMNGVFTVKWQLGHDEMFAHVQKTIKNIFEKTRAGLAVNFLSTHVDWQRSDLFHLEFDKLAAFIKEELSRNFVIRQDYGLYEYTAYIYRSPSV